MPFSKISTRTTWTAFGSDVLPQSKEPGSERKRELPKAPEGAPRILYAEDQQTFRNSVAYGLRLQGYDVTSVKDGQELIDTLLAEPAFDLVVTDNQMPVMSGLQVLKKIAEYQRFENLPIIVFSGDDTKAVVEEAGAVFLEKGESSANNLGKLIKEMLATTT